jgi:Tol biopolymer transport system component
MRYLTFLLLYAMAAGVNYASAGDDVRNARYPALAADGKTIAFSYTGDIWTVPSTGGEANRLTAHLADDIMPNYSPDGRWIAFSSSRFGNYDVFLMPSEGGTARQLTFNSASDYVSGWFPESDSILFHSDRNGGSDVFKIAVSGGMPIKLTGYDYERESGGRISPDRRYLCLSVGSGLSSWWRRDLRAGRESNVYMLDRSKGRFESTRVTTSDHSELWPVPDFESKVVYFVSARGDSYAQIFAVPFDGGNETKLTAFDDDGVQWLNSNPQGTRLVFEQGFQIWALDSAGASPRNVPIRLKTDEQQNLFEAKTFDGNIEWYSLSPDEKKVAFIVHGEVFVSASSDAKDRRRITNTAARERFVEWGDDSRTLYYASDRDGSHDIFSADAMTSAERRLTETPEDETKPLVSPDGKYLIYYRGLDKIIRYDIKRNTETDLVKGVFFDLGVEPTIEYAWSPDSKWLTFSMAVPTYETEIYAVDLDGAIHNLSRSPGWNFRPRFSSDGKIVYFSSSINDEVDTYKIDLTRKPTEFAESSLDSLFDEELADKLKKDSNGTSTPPPVRIDPNQIERRLSRPYSLPFSTTYPVLTPDGERYVFVSSVQGKDELWTVKARNGEDLDLKQVTRNGGRKSDLRVTSDSKTVCYLCDGKICSIGLDGADAKTLDTKVDLVIDQLANNRQKFNETWSMLNSYFYDPLFHGADWAKARDKYSPVVDHVRQDREFRDLVLEMMGELRASHLYIYPRTSPTPPSLTTAQIGIELDYSALDSEGVFIVAEVVPDSPADVAGMTIGCRIYSLSGVKLSRATDMDSILAGTEGRRVIADITDSDGGNLRKVEIKPCSKSAIDRLEYTDWVARRRNMVDSLSAGRLAYIHIPEMSQEWLRTFKRELVSIAEPRQGLIIDVRNNGGGSTAVNILEMLVKSPYILRNFRGFPVTSENKMRSKAYEKPMALLINGYSGSNSEIFAEGFRKLRLGKIIGEPTAGGVIGTSSFTLIDGATVRRPSWGAYTTEMHDTDLEPRQPDILVENLLDDFMNDRDPQLVRAVEELLRLLQ